LGDRKFVERGQHEFLESSVSRTVWDLEYWDPRFHAVSVFDGLRRQANPPPLAFLVDRYSSDNETARQADIGESE
jgi:hypothetical protein